jgi:hypothetical protein
MSGILGLDLAGLDRRWTVHPHHTQLSSGVTLPVATIPVDDPNGFPTSGSVEIGGDTVTYTAYSATAGQWNLTGCSGGSGAKSSGANVTLTKTAAGIIIGAVGGDIAAQDDNSADTVVIGKVGTSGEAGIKAGASNSVAMFRGANNEWWIDDDMLRVKRSGGATAIAWQSDSDTFPRGELGTFGWKIGSGTSATDLSIRRGSSTQVRIRDAGDTADRDLRLRALELGASGPTISAGSGTPEGAVTAPVGSHFHRTDGGAGTSFYVKESGSGNTGWVAK